MKKAHEQNPLVRDFLILAYLKKFSNDWKNKNEIAHHYGSHGLHRGRLDRILDNFIVKGFIEKKEADNPQAKWEYKITDTGISFVKKTADYFKDPIAGLMVGIPKDFDFDVI